MRTRVKICGITSTEAIAAAAGAGVDALGFVMYEPSVRFVSAAKTMALLAVIPPFTTSVGLFVNHGPEEVKGVLDQCNFDLLQFHGDEDNAFCRSFGKPFVKSIRVGTDTDIAKLARRYPDSVGILLDTMVDGRYGGTGEVFDWHRVPVLDKPIILAGGLTTENIGEAIAAVHPYAIDVSGGVESSPAVKDETLIRKLIDAVSIADGTTRELL